MSLFKFINPSIQTIKSGRRAGEEYVLATLVDLSNPNDAGRNVALFNPNDKTKVLNAAATGEEADLTEGRLIDIETISLGVNYWHFQEREGQRIYDTDATGKRKLYNTMRVLTMYSTKKHIRVDSDGNIVYIPGTTTPAECFDMEHGRIKRYYADGWSPERRRDDMLAAFYEIANTAQQPATQQPNEQPQQSGLQGTILQQPAAQQTAAQPQVNPFNVP